MWSEEEICQSRNKQKKGQKSFAPNISVSDSSAQDHWEHCANSIHVLVHRRKIACLTLYMVQYLAAAARNVGQGGTRSRDIHVAT